MTDATTGSTAATTYFYMDSADDSAAGGWIFTAGTFCAGEGTLSVYVRGGAAGSLSNTITGMANTIYNRPEESIASYHWNSCNIGNRGQNGTQSSAGLIDDVRIYHRAFSEVEIDAIYHQTRGGGYGDLAIQPTRFHHLPVADEAAIVPQAIHHYQMAGGL